MQMTQIPPKNICAICKDLFDPRKSVEICVIYEVIWSVRRVRLLQFIWGGGRGCQKSASNPPERTSCKNRLIWHTLFFSLLFSFAQPINYIFATCFVFLVCSHRCVPSDLSCCVLRIFVCSISRVKYVLYTCLVLGYIACGFLPFFFSRVFLVAPPPSWVALFGFFSCHVQLDVPSTFSFLFRFDIFHV